MKRSRRAANETRHWSRNPRWPSSTLNSAAGHSRMKPTSASQVTCCPSSPSTGDLRSDSSTCARWTSCVRRRPRSSRSHPRSWSDPARAHWRGPASERELGTGVDQPEGHLRALLAADPPDRHGHQWPTNDLAADADEVKVVVLPADVSQGRPGMARPHVGPPGSPNRGCHPPRSWQARSPSSLHRRPHVGARSRARPNARRTEPAHVRIQRSSIRGYRCLAGHPSRVSASALPGREIGIASDHGSHDPVVLTARAPGRDQLALVPFER